MGQAGAAHRVGILLAHRILVPGGERGCDRAARPGEASADVVVKVTAHSVKPGRHLRVDHGHRPDRPPDRTEPAKPGIACEIMRAGKRHRWRRGEPRLELDPGARGNALGRILLRQRDPDSRGKARGRSDDGQAQVALCGERLDQFDPPVDVGHLGMIEPRRGDHGRPQPDEAAAERHRNPEPGKGAGRPALPPAQSKHCRRSANTEQAHPCAGTAKREPHRDTEAE